MQLYTPLPRWSKIDMAVVGLELVLYGANCVLFGTGLYIMTSRKKKSHWILLISSVLLFFLATTHAVLLLGGEVISAAETEKTDTFWVIVRGVVFVLTVFTQDLLLIWRLYVVWCHNWKVCVFPLIVEAFALVCAFLMVDSWRSADDSSTSWSLSLISSSLGAAMNAGLTCSIAFRLWQMGRRVSFINDSSLRNPYKTSIIIVLESGGLFTLALIVTICVNAAKVYDEATAVDILEQLAVTTPLFIVFCSGIGYTDRKHTFGGNSVPRSPMTRSPSPFVAGVARRSVSETGSNDDGHVMNLESSVVAGRDEEWSGGARV